MVNLIFIRLKATYAGLIKTRFCRKKGYDSPNFWQKHRDNSFYKYRWQSYYYLSSIMKNNKIPMTSTFKFLINQKKNTIFCHRDYHNWLSRWQGNLWINIKSIEIERFINPDDIKTNIQLGRADVWRHMRGQTLKTRLLKNKTYSAHGGNF